MVSVIIRSPSPPPHQHPSPPSERPRTLRARPRLANTAATGGENDRSASGRRWPWLCRPRFQPVVPAAPVLPPEPPGRRYSGAPAFQCHPGGSDHRLQPEPHRPLLLQLIYLVSSSSTARTVSVWLHTARSGTAALHLLALTGVLGMVPVVQLNWGLYAPFDMLFWHVETGIVMSFISFFHIGWHFRYYRNLLGRKHGRSEMASSPQLGGSGRVPNGGDDRVCAWKRAGPTVENCGRRCSGFRWRRSAALTDGHDERASPRSTVRLQSNGLQRKGGWL